MATFYFNSYSGESMNSQWIKHIQSSAYINDIDGIVSKNRRELESTIRNASSEQAKAINQVCGKLDDGFAAVSKHLIEINSNISDLRSEINEMAAMLDWKLSLLIEEQRLTNELLGKIAKLLRIPDSQKQRVYHIEQGLKYLKNAILEEDIDSSFYIDAMEGFKEAEKIEKKDFVTLNRIGQIHLYSKKFLNIPLAEEYFLKAARESFAESNVGGTTTSTFLSPQENNESSYNHNPFKVATAESFLYASRCCYLQQKLPNAIELAEKAYKLIPELFEAGFAQAKYLAANNKDFEAAEILKTVIDNDRLFSIKVLNDQDLSNKAAILAMLEFIQREAISKAKSELEKCTDIIGSNSNAKHIVDEIQLNISKNSYLSAMKALDLLNANYSFEYYTYRRGNRDTNISKIAVNNSQKLIEFIKCENSSPREYERVAKEIKDEVSSDTAFSYGFGGSAIGFVLGIFKGCTLKEFSMEWGTFFITIVICGGISALVGYLIGQGTEPTMN